MVEIRPVTAEILPIEFSVVVVGGGGGGWCAKSFFRKTQTLVRVRLSLGWVGVLTTVMNSCEQL